MIRFDGAIHDAVCQNSEPDEGLYRGLQSHLPVTFARQKWGYRESTDVPPI
jgi:hypothetical protein